MTTSTRNRTINNAQVLSVSMRLRMFSAAVRAPRQLAIIFCLGLSLHRHPQHVQHDHTTMCNFEWKHEHAILHCNNLKLMKTRSLLQDECGELVWLRYESLVRAGIFITCNARQRIAAQYNAMLDWEQQSVRATKVPQ
jgi:hypothetical protein